MVAFSSSAPDEFEGFRAAQLPGQFSPQGAYYGSVRFGDGIAGGYLVADQHHAPRFRQCGDIRLPEHIVRACEFARRSAREQVIQRQHGVRFPASEVGLELHHRIAASVCNPLHGLRQQAFQAFGKVSAAKEFLRISVFVGPFAKMGLPQVCGEFGLLVPPARHVLMRRNDFAPGRKRGVCGCFDQRPARLAFFTAHLFVVDKPAQFFLHAVDFVGLLRCRDGGEQSKRRIEDAIRIVAREGFLVRPPVSPFEEFRNQTAFGVAQRYAEHFPPCGHHQFQEGGDVPFADGLVRQIRIVRQAQEVFRGGGLAFFALEFALYVGCESLTQQFQRLVDPFAVTDGHCSVDGCFVTRALHGAVYAFVRFVWR